MEAHEQKKHKDNKRIEEEDCTKIINHISRIWIKIPIHIE